MYKDKKRKKKHVSSKGKHIYNGKNGFKVFNYCNNVCMLVILKQKELNKVYLECLSVDSGTKCQPAYKLTEGQGSGPPPVPQN